MAGSRLLSIAAVVGLALAGASGALTGMALAERANAPSTDVLTLTAPQSAPDTREALRSPAGFTGFEDLALAGPVKRTGEVADVEGGAFAVVDGPARLEVDTTAPDRLYRIRPATSPLAVGDVIVVRLDGRGEPVAVLRVPRDLRGGGD